MLETIPLDSSFKMAMVVTLLHGLQGILEVPTTMDKMGGVLEMDSTIIMRGVREME